VLDELEACQGAVDNYNAIAPSQAVLMTTINFDARGGRPAEQRIERSRRVLGTFWQFVETGREVPANLVGKIEANGARGVLEIVDFDNAVHDYHLREITGHGENPDQQWQPKRKVPVVFKRRVEILFDEARPAFVPEPLRVHLPIVVAAVDDPRPARQQITQVIVEDVEPEAKVEESAA
jgi:hypothetical protein